MYRQGIGDCMLLTLPRAEGRSFFMLIDCGVLLGTPDAQEIMRTVLQDVATTTENHLDVVVATHEHWDHISGFIQAADVFSHLEVDQVWLAWTEDPKDELARKLAAEHRSNLAQLQMTARRLHLEGDTPGAAAIAGLLEFFGAGTQGTSRDALEAVRGKTANPRYCRPTDEPTLVDGTKARIFVLGPPLDEKLIKRARPSARGGEAYEATQAAFRANVIPAVAEAPQSPFSTLFTIPRPVAEEMPFFNRYWAAEPWRRIDTSWMDEATELALQLDGATNNSSLVVAIRLEDGDVLLFAADAQVGSWLSWQDLKWNIGNATITGPDLLRRTVVYKVGHHGSHNATLRRDGLEIMDNLEIAMIPVDQDVARQRHWGRMPLPSLVSALEEKTHGVVLQSDQKAPPTVAGLLDEHDLYFEVTI
jgi:hypothetical protein